MNYDVIIYDNVGLPVYHKKYDSEPLGGSEFEQLLLAEGLAASGLKVLYLSKNEQAQTIKYEKGLLEFKSYIYQNESCNSLILIRNSTLSDVNSIKYNKCFVWAHDTNWGNVYINAHGNLFGSSSNVILVCVSNWQKVLFDVYKWPTIVMPNMIPDWVYDMSIPKKTVDFVYASAAHKGINETMQTFFQLKQNIKFKDSQLNILNPGYEQVTWPPLPPGLNVLGALPFPKVVEEIAKSTTLLYYNVKAETFGIVPALAQILKTKPVVYQADKTFYSPGAVKEVLNNDPLVTDNFHAFVSNAWNIDVEYNPKIIDYRQSTIVKQWLLYVQ